MMIREIARQIVQEQFIQNWVFYLVLLLVFLVSAPISNFVSSYFRKRGEGAATKADIASITKAIEQVKTEIAHSDWALRENKTIRRGKLEELIESVYALRPWLSKEEAHAFILGQKMKSSTLFLK
jgi:hypothetical protein